MLDREYWLKHSEGFLVDTLAGDEVGVVDDVETEPDSGRVVTLIVGCGWFGRRHLAVPVDEVEIIDPSSQRLFVRRAPDDAAAARQRRARR